MPCLRATPANAKLTTQSDKVVIKVRRDIQQYDMPNVQPSTMCFNFKKNRK